MLMTELELELEPSIYNNMNTKKIYFLIIIILPHLNIYNCNS